MDIREKINLDQDGLIKEGAINIVAFGDSVTHGAVGTDENGCDEIEYETVYWNRLRKKINSFRPFIPVNVINAGIGGTTASASLKRLQRDVLSHHPDLIIICFGLNDINCKLDDFVDAMKQIFEKCRASGADVIYMTPNMLNTYVADDVLEKDKDYAHITAEYQNNGRMDEYMKSVCEAAENVNIKVCDCYSEWKRMAKNGEDTTMLLANRINHPNREMHMLFADMLFDTIMGNETKRNINFSTMYQDNGGIDR